jgi:hypothetical protein
LKRKDGNFGPYDPRSVTLDANLLRQLRGYEERLNNMPVACQLASCLFEKQAGLKDPEDSRRQADDCKGKLAGLYKGEELSVHLKQAEEWVKHSLAQKEREDAIFAAHAEKKAADDAAKVEAARDCLRQLAAARDEASKLQLKQTAAQGALSAVRRQLGNQFGDEVFACAKEFVVLKVTY